jgi:hypothetical protein
MKKDLLFLLAHARRTAVFALVAALPVLLLYIDIHWLKDGVGEWSVVELTQLGFLLASVLAFARLARHRPEDRAAAWLVAGLFASMLVRELDALWDLLFHGCWQLLVALIAASASINAWRDRERTLPAMVRLLSTRAGTVMTVGLVLLVVYSRLFGLTVIWQGLLSDGYVRVVKNAAEEGTELLAYTFILGASLSYAAQRLRQPTRQAGPATVREDTGVAARR